MSVLFPECLVRLIMDFHSIAFEEVQDCTCMYSTCMCSSPYCAYTSMFCVFPLQAERLMFGYEEDA